MSVYSIILKRRSIRKFKQRKISLAILKILVNAARLAPSAGNLQPCEYVIITERLGEVFACLKWAGYIVPEGNPPEAGRPVAYIVILINKDKAKFAEYSIYDAAASAENIILAAQEKGVGSCWIGSVDVLKLAKILNIPQNCEINSVVALGYPDQISQTEPFRGDIKYWKDSKGNFHVPKRRLEEILHINVF